MNSDSRSIFPVERSSAYSPATSFWQIAPLVEFQYVKTGSPSAAESRSITGWVRSIRTGGLIGSGRRGRGISATVVFGISIVSDDADWIMVANAAITKTKARLAPGLSDH